MVVRKILETTLTAGQTSVHFTDSDIPYSLIRVYTSDPDLLPIERTLSGNTVTVYFEEQTSNVGVALEIVKAGLDIIDDLTSTDATAALSANQGKVLKDAIDDIEVPTVNDGTLTIQKNGTTVTTFTANQASASTANIEVIDMDDVETAIEPKADKTIIGTEENGATASKAYTVGEHFIKNGKFCTAIASISSGATLTLNTNYVEGTVAEKMLKPHRVEQAFTPSALNVWDTIDVFVSGVTLDNVKSVSVHTNSSLVLACLGAVGSGHFYVRTCQTVGNLTERKLYIDYLTY